MTLLTNHILLWILTIGIVLIKILWISTEIRAFNDRVNKEMIINNSIEAFILILQILCAMYLPWPATGFVIVLTVLGVIMYITGVILALWARATMNQSWGIPGKHDIKKQEKLVTTGPFKFSRNPIYVGFILIYFGYALAIRSWLIILRIPLVLYFYKSAFREEQNLEKYFGKEYVDYKKRVPRFLLV